MTICPLHRAKLGLGWARGAIPRYRILPSLYNHGKKKGEWPKAKRGIGKNESKTLLSDTGIILPVGSGKVLIKQNHKTNIFPYGKRSALNHFKIDAYNFLPKFNFVCVLNTLQGYAEGVENS